jgi:hypothetical protein
MRRTDRKPCKQCGQVHEWCTAHRKTDGAPCGRRPKDGADVCKGCGGGAPQVKAAAARREQERAARSLADTLGVPEEVDPKEAILREISFSAGHVAWFRRQVEALDADTLVWGQTSHRYGEGPEGPIDVTEESAAVNMWLKLYDQERDRFHALCLAAIKVGIDERRVRLEEAKAELLVEGLQWMIGEARKRLDLSEAAVAALTDIVRETMQRLERLESSTAGARRG